MQNPTFLATLCEQGYFLDDTGGLPGEYNNIIYDRFGFRLWKLESSTEVILVFIGSDDLMDWIANSAARLVPYSLGPQGKVHRGFLVGARLLYKQFSDCIPYWHSKTITCVGHSLGGALATLTAAALSVKYPQLDVSLCSIASPNVGDCEFRDLIKTLGFPVYRIAHPFDLIASLPPAFMGYSCILPNYLKVQTTNTVDRKDRPLLDYIYSWIAFRLLRAKFKQWIKYHDISTYQTILNDFKYSNDGKS